MSSVYSSNIGMDIFKTLGSLGTFDPVEKITSLVSKVNDFAKLCGVNVVPAANFVGSCKSFNAVANLFKLPGTIYFFFDKKNKDASQAKKGFMITLLFVDALSTAESIGKFIDKSRISNLSSRIPVVGQTVANFNIGIVIQPFLVLLSSFSIADQSGKLAGNSRLQNRVKDKIAFWNKEDTYIGARLDYRNTPRNRKKRNKFSLNTSHEFYNGDTNTIKIRKAAKWEAKLVNAERECTKSWITIATDVAKIVSAIATFVLLTGMAGAAIPALPAIVTTLALAAAVLNATKGVYGLYMAVSQKAATEVRMTNYMAASAA